MTVKELIEMLKEMPQNAKVLMNGDYDTLTLVDVYESTDSVVCLVGN